MCSRNEETMTANIFPLSAKYLSSKRRKREKRMRTSRSLMQKLASATELSAVDPSARLERTTLSKRVIPLSISDTEGLYEESELKELKSSAAIPPVDASRYRFPYCVVWTPLPVVAWLAPFVGHVGICKEDGVILDFAGQFLSMWTILLSGLPQDMSVPIPRSVVSRLICLDILVRMVLLIQSWELVFHGMTRCAWVNYQHKSYNLFTCNCHCFTASCMNRLAYQGSIRWNIIDIAVFVLLKGRWVNYAAILRLFGPFFVVMTVGLLIAGWPFLIGWAAFSGLLVGWFLIATYFMSDVIHC